MNTAVAIHTDEDLARAAGSGDARALEALARRCWPDLRRWALIELGDPVQADDAVQEALVRLMRFADRFDPSRPFRPWLKTLLRRTCHDVRRRAARHDDRSAPEVDIGRSADPGRALDLDRAARRAAAALEDLSPRQRQIWLLCEREGLSAVQAAEQLEVEPGTARALLYQARKALRKRLLLDTPELHDLVRGP